jgi:hypothetical protein
MQKEQEPVRKTYLTKKDIQLIKKFMPEYKAAAKKIGVPVLALPAIHYRESGLRLGFYSFKRKVLVKNLGGPFMLDCGGGGAEFTQRIREYEKKVFKLYYGDSQHTPKVSHQFWFACLVAAYELKTKMRPDKWKDALLPDALWGYNGRVTWCGLESSSYVWNDPKNGHPLKMRVNGIESIDTRPGTMIIYQELQDLEEQGEI